MSTRDSASDLDSTLHVRASRDLALRLDRLALSIAPPGTAPRRSAAVRCALVAGLDALERDGASR